MKKIYYLYAWILGWPAFSKFNYLIYHLSLRAIGIYNYQNSKISGEKWLLNHIAKLLGKNLVIFDVGANIGNYTKDVLEAKIDVEKVYAFEPHPNTFSTLENNLSIYSNAFPVMVALSDKEGEMFLFDREGCEGTSHASLSSEIFIEIYGVENTKRAVPVTTLDSFCDKNNVDMIDFLKIDVEGFELNVLQGASIMLAKGKIRIIQFEFTQLNSIIGVFFKNIYDMLYNDYDIYRLLPHGLYKINKYKPTMCEIFGYQNFVAILKSKR